MDKDKKIKVLLVDDEKVFASTLSERLQARDVEAKAVFGGSEALDDIAREEPDVMILDLKMPDMDGMEVLRRVREKYPKIETIILSGHGSAATRDEAVRLGAVDFLEKPVDIGRLVRKINGAFHGMSRQNEGSLYSYRDFTAILKQQLERLGISLGENGLGVKCFCRDDNQDQIGNLLAGIGRSSGWFDLNSFGAFPAGRGIESLGPAAHHIPDMKGSPWIVLVHATHVGCDSAYTLGTTDRYGMQQASSSCGLLSMIIARHKKRKSGQPVNDLQDFEMSQTEKVLQPYLDEIVAAEYPMAAIADRLLDLGYTIFDDLLAKHVDRAVYVGGINVDFDPQQPGKNLFVPKIACVYEKSQRTEIDFNS